MSSFVKFVERADWVTETNRLCKEEGWTLLEVSDITDYSVSYSQYQDLINARANRMIEIERWVRKNAIGKHRNWNAQYAFELESDAVMFALKYL